MLQTLKIQSISLFAIRAFILFKVKILKILLCQNFLEVESDVKKERLKQKTYKTKYVDIFL
jgi:hypothetical protein